MNPNRIYTFAEIPIGQRFRWVTTANWTDASIRVKFNDFYYQGTEGIAAEMYFCACLYWKVIIISEGVG